jgi:hypothetical protein
MEKFKQLPLNKSKEGLIMKTLTVLAAFFTLFLVSCSSTYNASAPYDEVYSTNKSQPATTAERVTVVSEPVQQNTGYEGDYYSSGTGTAPQDTTAFDPEGYYDYEYASRLKRFEGQNTGFDYYDSYYTNVYNYNGDPGYYGSSIYDGWGCGYPYGGGMSLSLGFGWGWGSFGFGYPYYGMGYPYYGFYDPWGYYPGYYGYYPGSYWSAYTNGYWDGYYGYPYNPGGYYPYYDYNGANGGYYGHRGTRSGNSNGTYLSRGNKSGNDPNPAMNASADPSRSSRTVNDGVPVATQTGSAGIVPTSGEVSTTSSRSVRTDGGNIAKVKDNPASSAKADPGKKAIVSGNEVSGLSAETRKSTNPAAGTQTRKIAAPETQTRSENPMTAKKSNAPDMQYQKPEAARSAGPEVKTTSGKVATSDTRMSPARKVQAPEQKYEKPKTYTAPKYRTTPSSQEYSRPSTRSAQEYSKPENNGTRKIYSVTPERRSPDTYSRSSSETRSYSSPSVNQSRSYSAPSQSRSTYSAPSSSGNRSYSAPSSSYSGGSRSSSSSSSSSSGSGSRGGRR